MKPAPQGRASLSFLSRCEGPGPAPRMEEIAAEPLKIGMIPTAIPRALANDLTDKTRVWKLASPDFDFYRILSGGRPGGLRPDRPSAACIRYAMEGVAEMEFSLTYDPKRPEILTIAPARIRYRGFAARAAVRVTLSLKTYSLERTAGRQSASLQNEEMAVEILPAGGPVEIRYDPAGTANAKIPLPPWDYSPASETPRHNLSVLSIAVTEIADFDWLQSQARILWPGWEYEATDAAKLKSSADFFSRSHAAE
jgi:hypothetical protein